MYHIQVADNAGFNNPILDRNVNQNFFAYNAPALKELSTYYWRVQAINSCNTGDYSAVSEFKTRISSPGAPLSLLAVEGAGPVANLNWTDNSNNEEGFIITRRLGTGKYSNIDTVAANVTSYIDTKVFKGNAYTYAIIAYNDGGRQYSNPQTLNISNSISRLDLESLKLFPNPSIEGNINLQMEGAAEGIGMKVFTLDSKLIFERPISNVELSTGINLDLKLRAGLYLIRLKSKSGLEVNRKLLVQ
jgi:hypothetical protein